MPKLKTIYLCQNCGHKHDQWVGKCQNCSEWNTIIEEVVEKGSEKVKVLFSSQKAERLNEVSLSLEERLLTPDGELNRVLGGGMVLGSSILIGGEPGIGKSTLMLQLAVSLKDKKVLYVSGEESASQVKLRAQRLTNDATNHCLLYTNTNTSEIIQQLKEIQPSLLIIDSVQTLSSESIDSSPGSISQIRQCTSELTKYTKKANIPMVLIGHINKEGSIAGPKIMEHMVDVVILFEGDRNHVFRLLRGQKNRFGSSSEIGIYEMTQKGLKEVSNPSFIMNGSNHNQLSGNAVGIMVEGIRPMVLEVQALVGSAVYGTPQRATTGFDARRLNMLLAVLEKRAEFPLASKDVFLNITGGIKVEDPAMDLSIIAAILSSASDLCINPKTCFAAEVGLSGELRPVIRIEQRIQEASKLGFSKIIVAKEKEMPNGDEKIEVIGIEKVSELKSYLL